MATTPDSLPVTRESPPIVAAVKQANAEPDTSSVVAEEVLGVWGRAYNLRGPKPHTYRRVKRTVIEEVTERYCSTCRRYLPLSTWGAKKTDKCRDCLSAQWKAENSGAERRERMRWGAHRQRANKLGALHDITVEAWLELVGSWAGCAVPGCDGPFERIDHIVSFTAGGSNTATNLQPLCRNHHTEKTRAERATDASGLWGAAS